eukprot:SAG11_NODE_4752_length_1779_cov_37.624405_2_plen_83_part_00
MVVIACQINSVFRSGMSFHSICSRGSSVESAQQVLKQHGPKLIGPCWDNHYIYSGHPYTSATSSRPLDENRAGRRSQEKLQY